MATKFLKKTTRRRPMDPARSSASSSLDGSSEVGKAEMKRCLTTLDLVSIGVGSCCGTGMYLTAGIITVEKAGPAGIISLLIAGIGSILTGIHYSDLAGLCPYTSGSVYMYSYITVGELSAFVIGWGVIAEYVIGAAANAVALSKTIHSLDHGQFSGFLDSAIEDLGLPHIDILAMVVCLLLTWVLAAGVEMSARFNNGLNMLNFFVWTLFLTSSFYLGQSTNVTKVDGFFPFGLQGVVQAIPTAYFAFVGFDGLTTTGAECKDPVKSVPYAIIMSIAINIVVFISIVVGLSWAEPFNKLPPNTAMLDVFAIMGHPTLKYLMAIGAVAGLFAATFGSLFPLPRVLQAMAQDGLVFRYFSRICSVRHTAMRATVTSGLVATFLAGFVDLGLLIELVLIGTLLGYVIVSFATLVTRYIPIPEVFTHVPLDTCDVEASPGLKRKASDNNLEYHDHQYYSYDNNHKNILDDTPDANEKSTKDSNELLDVSERHFVPPRLASSSSTTLIRRQDSNETSNGCVDPSDNNMYTSLLLGATSRRYPWTVWNNLREKLGIGFNAPILENERMTILMLTYVGIFVLCAILSYCSEPLFRLDIAVSIIFLTVLLATLSLMIVLMCLQKVRSHHEGFKAPFVPVITFITAGCNMYMMTSLRIITWLLFLAWMLTGLCIYFFYGIKHSSLNETERDPLYSPIEDDAEVPDVTPCVPVSGDDVTTGDKGSNQD
ncbi:cationic amino acid transporter 3 [Aplysia californica]|uniref:Cationic amino acid transporter 3 n=1 Tax=Aplysia californica TaxID=6500 RepID=A0ABM0JR91_APLCA|nr:cationic amino acid transporter 3 [Aplysia californica]